MFLSVLLRFSAAEEGEEAFSRNGREASLSSLRAFCVGCVLFCSRVPACALPPPFLPGGDVLETTPSMRSRDAKKAFCFTRGTFPVRGVGRSSSETASIETDPGQQVVQCGGTQSMGTRCLFLWGGQLAELGRAVGVGRLMIADVPPCRLFLENERGPALPHGLRGTRSLGKRG